MATEDWKLSVCKHEASSSETIGRVYGVGFHLVMAIDRRVDRIRRHYAGPMRQKPQQLQLQEERVCASTAVRVANSESGARECR